MDNEKYPTFESWFYEVESYGTRAERFWDSVEAFSVNASVENTMIWLRAAFDAAKDNK